MKNPRQLRHSTAMAKECEERAAWHRKQAAAQVPPPGAPGTFRTGEPVVRSRPSRLSLAIWYEVRVEYYRDRISRDVYETALALLDGGWVGSDTAELLAAADAVRL